MIHLIKNKEGNFDVVVTAGGRQLHHSKQGFERKAGAYNHIDSLANELGNFGGVAFQDETTSKTTVCFIDDNLQVSTLKKRPGARYVEKLMKLVAE